MSLQLAIIRLTAEITAVYWQPCRQYCTRNTVLFPVLYLHSPCSFIQESPTICLGWSVHLLYWYTVPKVGYQCWRQFNHNLPVYQCWCQFNHNLPVHLCCCGSEAVPRFQFDGVYARTHVRTVKSMFQWFYIVCSTDRYSKIVLIITKRVQLLVNMSDAVKPILK